MEEITKKIIDAAIHTGEWPDEISLNECRQWMAEQKLADQLTEQNKPIKCPCCEQSNNMYKITLSIRNLRFMLRHIWLSDRDMKSGGDGYINYKEIQAKLREDTGSVLSSYSPMTKFPWDFMAPRIDTDHKVKRDGCFIPTKRGREWARGHISIPETIYMYNGSVTDYSKHVVSCKHIKDVNFQELMDEYRTW